MTGKLPGMLVTMVLAWPLAAFAAADVGNETGERYRLSGSFKSLPLVSRTPFLEEKFWSDLNRLRLALDVDVSERVKFHATLDNEWLIGTVLDRQEFQLIKDNETDTLLDLDTQVVDSSDLLWRASLYRIHMSFAMDRSKLVLGRQRIAWGSGRLWNPVDLFNPISPLQVEQDQREGVDAINLEYYPGSFSTLNLVFAAGEESEDNSIGLRAGTQLNGYDLNFMAGEFREDLVIGLDFAGSAGGSGVRGEATYTDAEAGGDYWRAVLGWDYSFPNTLYLMLEYLYNGGNVESASDFTIDSNPRVFSSEIVTRNRNFLGGVLAYEITPLVRVSSLLVYDIDDDSTFLAPALEYSILKNLDLTLGAQLFSGSDSSEYGDQNDVYFGSLELFF